MRRRHPCAGGGPMKRYIAYYRVSTDRQGRSGLGLEAQRASVAEYASQRGAVVLEEFTDVQSGRSQDRPSLAAALAAARRTGATLVVAKLDRLARNARFLAELVDGDVDVVFCNLPDLPPGSIGRFMVQIMASIAELESGMISDRTSAALQAAKARGVKLGGYRGGSFKPEVIEQGWRTRVAQADVFAQEALEQLQRYMAEGVSSRTEMARRLNQDGYRTPSGRGTWSTTSVSRVLNRLADAERRKIAEAKKRSAELLSVASTRGRPGQRQPMVRLRA